MKNLAVHPGEILCEEFLKPRGLSQNALALALRVPPQRVSELARGKRALSVDTALRLSAYFGVTAEFWLGLQTRYDLDVAAEAGLARKIKSEVDNSGAGA